MNEILRSTFFATFVFVLPVALIAGGTALLIVRGRRISRRGLPSDRADWNAIAQPTGPTTGTTTAPDQTPSAVAARHRDPLATAPTTASAASAAPSAAPAPGRHRAEPPHTSPV